MSCRAADGRKLCDSACVRGGVDQGIVRNIICAGGGGPGKGCAISCARGAVDKGAQGAPVRNVVCAGCAISSGRGAEQGLLDKGGRATLLGISSARGWCGLVYEGGWWTRRDIVLVDKG